MKPCLLALIAAVTLVSPFLAAHGEAGSSSFDLKVPNMPLNGAITFVSLVGPASGVEVLHTKWNLTYVAPPGGTPASSLILELTMPLASGQAEWAVTGAELGWPAATGTFSASLGSDQLNGVLGGGPFAFTVPELVMLSSGGGVTGQFIHSTIELELAEVCQADLGFAGPGAVHLAVCGELLATGGEATLSLDGAPAFSPALLVAGLGFAPTAFKGGTLVPLPILVAVPVAVDATGALELQVPGGGALTVHLQAIVLDGSQVHGIALSNAVQVELKP